MIGLDALTLTVRNLEIQVNGSNVPNRVVNFVHTNSYGAGGLEIPTGGDPVFITFSTELLRASADITLSISQFVYISGKFAFEKGAPLTLMPRTGGHAPVDLSVIKVGATDVHAFVGIGGPYWVTDPDGTVHAPVGTSSAIGLKLSEVEFGLALMKPVTGPAVSYYALTATIGEIALLSPFPGFELSADTLNIRVNGSNAADKHVINLSTRTISVPTSGTTSVTIGGTAEWGTALLEAEGNVHVEVFELSLDAHVYFRMTTRQNGTRVILLAISGLSFVVGDPLDPIFELSGIHGALYLADAGFAGELTLPTFSKSIGDATTGMSFTATASIAINTTGARVQETFNTATGTETLDLDAGEYIRILVEGLALNVTVAGVSATLRGNFQFEQITLPVVGKVVRIAATEVTMGIGGDPAPVLANSSGTGVTLTNGRGALILFNDGIAAVFQGTFNVQFPGVNLEVSETTLVVNTRGPPPGGNVNQTITVSGTPVTVNVPGQTFRLFFTQVSVSFGDFLTLNGDFTIENVTTGPLTGATIYGANNVELFIGDGPYRLENGDVNPDAIGLLVTQGKVGVVDFGGGAFAIYAEGRAELVGFGTFVELDAPVTVRINHTGRAINKRIFTRSDNTEWVDVNFTSAQVIEKFTVGVPAVGSTPAQPAEIAFGRVVFIRGVIEFTTTPSGRVDVSIPVAEVGITIPDESEPDGLLDAFAIRGAAQFSFGGGMGFQLQDLRVTGFSIFGAGATIGNPATALRPPTADLGSPHAGATIASIDFVEGGGGTIEVVYNTFNPGAIIDRDTIIDDDPEFVLTGPAAGLVVNGRATQVDPNDPRRYRYSFTGALNSAGGTTVDVSFIAGSFADTALVSNAVSLQSFYVTFASPSSGPPKPSAVLVSPTSGSVVTASVLAARGYLDVKFINGTPDGCAAPGTTPQPPTCEIDGDELTLSSPTAATTLRLSTLTNLKVTRLTDSIWRYSLEPAAGVAVLNMFGAGVVNVTFAANRWRAGGVDNEASKATFTIATDVQTGGTATNPLSLGPLTLDGPSLTLADVKLDGTKLVLTVAIGVNSASLAFGSGGQGGMSATLTGILAKFFVEVDLMAAITAVTAGDVGAILSAFSVPGKFSLDVATVRVEVPNVVIATGAGIKVNWDANGPRTQTLLTVNTATVTFPTFGVSAEIAPFITGPGPDTIPGNQDDTFIPGLTVRGDGFKLGQATLIVRPTSGAPIDLFGLLQFDDLRIGVSNFGVTFAPDGTPSLDDGSGITFGSGGVRFLPGKPVNGQITDGTDADTNAITATVRFADGEFQSLELTVDTLKINIASVLTLTAQNFKLNTGAGPTQELVSFASIGATLNIGGLGITGEARNFAFMGDGSFRTKPGFGVFLSANGAGGSSFGWMDWLPVKITSLGIVWRDIQADPSDFKLILSAAVEGIHAIPNLEFSGAIEGIEIDVGKLLRGEFPITGIAAFGVGVKGDMFGGKIEAQLVGGILKLDAGGRVISDLDTVTPVVDRVFYAGLVGGFTFGGMGGFTIRLGLSELGPLSVALSVSLPTGIIIYPPFGLTINDFYASVEFFKSLPSIDEPEQLRGGAFQPPIGFRRTSGSRR